jgi:xanthine dehydrogenase YagT iron-sulfur-binding subunit
LQSLPARAEEPERETAGRREGPTRREVVAGTVATSLALAFAPGLLQAALPEETISATATAAVPPNLLPLQLDINGQRHRLAVDPRVTLLDALRERLHLTGTKKGCDHGQCGACTVHLDGRRVLACLTLAASAQGRAVTTIEGLARGAELHPMQQAFIEHDGFQCGYCTSGQIMSAVALLREPVGRSDGEVRESMSGNLCRCGAYPGIVAAIQSQRGSARREG